MRAHNDSIALRYKFYEILQLRETNRTIVKDMKALRERCIGSGFYFKHLLNWFSSFPVKNIHSVDGELLKANPSQSMNLLQKQLNVSSEDHIDYKDLLKYNAKKGFFCKVINSENNLTKCLGPGKGRKYNQIDKKSEIYLNKIYEESNSKFLKLLKKRNFTIPIWLNQTNTNKFL